ncbi:unnamed protein product [Rotaria sordida]|uniref:Uncharacterized protein n=1 Tax=Rotaria sordida TaxID=392033 RepID=A0A815REH3_9BILA|nr:unnamed protein product [Rotaria sordida]CAF1397734.1 unnamed protein product [Rotaria sordida]CAF1476100.1 unnamed protein product [Rotaria sordida]CAF3759805.1 unnamed protein product [Rotaria sordida]CAF3982881.1 unnamed protein product [Rotaria sordida]
MNIQLLKCKNESLLKEIENYEQHLLEHLHKKISTKAETWLGEQELYMMSEERGKDELSIQTFIHKHQTMEQTIENYSDILRELGDKAKNLIIDLEQSNLSRDLINE